MKPIVGKKNQSKVISILHYLNLSCVFRFSLRTHSNIIGRRNNTWVPFAINNGAYNISNKDITSPWQKFDKRWEPKFSSKREKMTIRWNYNILFYPATFLYIMELLICYTIFSQLFSFFLAFIFFCLLLCICAIIFILPMSLQRLGSHLMNLGVEIWVCS